MKALIVEDERPAQEALIRLLKRNFPDLEIAGVTETVSDTLAWLRTPGNQPDLIFMDVELTDGHCFEILQQEQIRAKIIMTTAYDKYAIKAFEAGSIDYLLKPIDETALQWAVNRCRAGLENGDILRLLQHVRTLAQEQKAGETAYRKRFIIHVGKHIIPVSTEDIAYFYVEGKDRYLTRKDGRIFYIDLQMEAILEELDPHEFFRVSRNYIVSIHAITGFERIFGSRLKLLLSPPLKADIIVARSRVHEFRDWIS